jgi:cyanate permease
MSFDFPDAIHKTLLHLESVSQPVQVTIPLIELTGSALDLVFPLACHLCILRCFEAESIAHLAEFGSGVGLEDTRIHI